MTKYLFGITVYFFSINTYAQRLVKEFIPGKENCLITYMGSLKNGFVFSSYSDDNGIEPWISDGTTAGTKMLKDIYPGTGSSILYSSIYATDSNIFFIAQESNRFGLWRTDGTPEGTIFLHKFDYTLPDKYYNEICFHKGLMYFISRDYYRTRLWSTDGTSSGTKQVHVFNDSGIYNATAINSWDDKLYIFASDREHGTELWTSDGTDAGTQLLKDIFPGSRGSIMIYKPKMLPAGNLLFFCAKASDQEGYELFCTDGTEAGTRLFNNFQKAPFASSYPNLVASTGNYVLMNTTDDSSTIIWKTDGTLTNTKPLFRSSIDSGIYNHLYSVFPYNNQYLLYIYSSFMGNELYTSDDQFNNIEMIKDINPKSQNSYFKDKMIMHNNKAYFLATNNMIGLDIWTTDGTFNNTLVYQEFVETKGIEDIIQWNDRIFFVGSVDLNIGSELYELDLNKNSDNSSVSTDRINIYPNPCHSGSFIKIDVENGTEIRWFNASGQLVHQSICTDRKTEVPTLSKGIYTIELNTGTQIHHSLLLVE